MANNYYVISVSFNTFEGPMSFKDAVATHKLMSEFGESLVITKVVVGIDGKEVK